MLDFLLLYYHNKLLISYKFKMTHEACNECGGGEQEAQFTAHLLCAGSGG